jgi:hypothetical protein
VVGVRKPQFENYTEFVNYTVLLENYTVLLENYTVLLENQITEAVKVNLVEYHALFNLYLE